MVLNFICRPSKARKTGLSPIELSIIINNQRSIITLDRQLHHSKFNTSTQKVKGDKELNEYLEVIRRKCYKLETELLKIDKLDIDTFVHSFKYGIPEKEDTLLKVYDKHNSLYEESVKCKKVDNTAYYKYIKNRERLFNYLQTMGKTDIKLSEITPAFVEGFQNYCLLTLKTNTTNKQMKMFKKILAFAVKERYIEVSPFQLTLKDEKLDYNVLSKKELDKLMMFEFSDKRIESVKDLFAFQCYTGLSYSDMAQLTIQDIDNDVIIGKRKKTDVQFVIPLLPVAKEILIKYNYQLPIISNQKYNAYLKVLGDVVGMGRNLHSHLGRHTFACLLLNSGVDMKTISRSLGHTSIKTTERIYAQMSNETVIKNIRRAII